MKNRNLKFVKLGILATAVSACMISGCGETTLPTPENDKTAVVDDASNDTTESDESTIERLSWVELGSLETNPDLRSAIDSIFKVTGSTGAKQGIIYETPTSSEGDTYTYDNNNTLDVAIHNYNFRETYDTNQADIATAARNSFIDLDDETDDVAIASALNTYFNLLPDTEDGAANPNETLTRAEVMAAITRAITPVTDDLTSDTSFNEAVGTTEYNDFAKELDADAFLSTKDKSLDTTTFTGKMTRGEAIYLLMNKFFPEEIGKFPEITFNDCINGGEYTGSNAGVLQKMLSESSSHKVDTRIYNAMITACNYSVLDKNEETNWDAAITKAEFIDLLTKTLYAETTSMQRFNVPDGVIDMTEDEYINSIVTGEYDPDNLPASGFNAYDHPEWMPKPSDYDGKKIRTVDDLPEASTLGYDYDKHPLYYSRTTKNYKCVVDGLTNEVYYANMLLPDGTFFGEDAEEMAMYDYIKEKGYDNYLQIPYDEAKELFGELDPSTMSEDFWGEGSNK